MAKIIIKQPEEVETTVEQATEESEPTIFDKQKQEPPMQIKMNMRRGLDGRLMIFEHDHIDIVFLPEKSKLIAFAKKDYSDIVYETQTRLFDFLVRKGMCSQDTIRSGNVYSSLEGVILKSKDELPIEQLLLLNLEKWLDKERPSLEMDKKYTEKFTDLMTEPDSDDSTELGEVPQEEEKGTIPKYASRRYIGGWW